MGATGSGEAPAEAAAPVGFGVALVGAGDGVGCVDEVGGVDWSASTRSAGWEGASGRRDGWRSSVGYLRPRNMGGISLPELSASRMVRPV